MSLALYSRKLPARHKRAFFIHMPAFLIPIFLIALLQAFGMSMVAR